MSDEVKTQQTPDNPHGILGVVYGATTILFWLDRIR